MNSTPPRRRPARHAAFLDTSILLRYLLRDDDRAEHCLALLQQAERGEVRLHTNVLVVAEIVWTLRSPRYGLSPEEIRDLLLPILSLRGLVIEDKKLYSTILDLYCQKNIDFTDAYNAVMMTKSRLTDIYSYDGHYDRLGFLQRVEP